MPRPTGVTVISILYFLVTLFLLLCGVVFIGLMGVAGLDARAHEMGPLGVLAGLGAVAGVVCLIIAVVVAFIGWGLWALKEWARIVAILFSGLGLLGGVAGFLGSILLRSHLFPAFGVIGAAAGLVRIAINAVILWYLLQPQVKQAFTG
ncbi:MAG TPA: hypothetical protein VE825_03205 [Terriglobales bacterium]|jgi:hypothetical protein|nr:hypothetical protein [Terriglobales bacterium]